MSSDDKANQFLTRLKGLGGLPPIAQDNLTMCVDVVKPTGTPWVNAYPELMKTQYINMVFDAYDKRRLQLLPPSCAPTPSELNDSLKFSKKAAKHLPSLTKELDIEPGFTAFSHPASIPFTKDIYQFDGELFKQAFVMKTWVGINAVARDTIEYFLQYNKDNPFANISHEQMAQALTPEAVRLILYSCTNGTDIFTLLVSDFTQVFTKLLNDNPPDAFET